MSEAHAPFPSDEQALERIAALDLAAAERVHAKLMVAETTGEIAELGRTYQRFARSLRQSLALRAKLRREREQAAAEAVAQAADERYIATHPIPVAKPPPSPTAVRIRTRELRQAALRVVWNEVERADFEEVSGLVDDIIGDEMLDPEFVSETLDVHLARVCEMLEIPAAATVGWRDLPDPPGGVVAPGPFSRVFDSG